MQPAASRLDKHMRAYSIGSFGCGSLAD